jgi:hypothetical protein
MFSIQTFGAIGWPRLDGAIAVAVGVADAVATVGIVARGMLVIASVVSSNMQRNVFLIVCLFRIFPFLVNKYKEGGNSKILRWKSNSLQIGQAD